MEKIYKTWNLRPADCIVEPLYQTGISKHFAIFLGSINGIEMVAENYKYDCVHIIPASQYFAGVSRIDRIERFPGTNAQRKDVVKRAFRMQGKKYDLLSYNCEHFANEVRTGKSFSNQVENAFALLGAIILIKGFLKVSK